MDETEIFFRGEWKNDCTVLGSTPRPGLLHRYCILIYIKLITFLVGNPYKPLFATVPGQGVDPTHSLQRVFGWLDTQKSD